MDSSETHPICPCDPVFLDSVKPAQLQPVGFLRKKVRILLVAPSVILGIPRVWCGLGSQHFPDQRRMVCTAATDGSGGTQNRTLPAVAPHHDALRAPDVGLPVCLPLHLVVPLSALDHGRHPAIPFPLLDRIPVGLDSVLFSTERGRDYVPWSTMCPRAPPLPH